ncbi:hypothetical protein TWF706_007289 [Orbilia oligospora]|nr:hypothetical protein TWF706_007289 [Orbilia oligospora]
MAGHVALCSKMRIWERMEQNVHIKSPAHAGLGYSSKSSTGLDWTGKAPLPCVAGLALDCCPYTRMQSTVLGVDCASKIDKKGRRNPRVFGNIPNRTPARICKVNVLDSRPVYQPTGREVCYLTTTHQFRI